MMQRKKWSYFFIGIGVQIGMGVAMSCVQAITLLLGFQSTSIEAKAIPVICLVGIPFNAGGWTVRTVFEVLATNRTDFVMSHLWLYLPLLMLQLLVVAAFIGRRLRLHGKFSDPCLVTLTVLLALNSFANLWWPWWGT